MDIGDEMKAYFDQKFAEMQERQKLQIQQQKPSSKPILLKSKGNQAQLEHQEELVQLSNEIEVALKEGDADSAIEKVSELRTSAQKRIKLIRFADKSDSGWNAVNEYVSDELASDSEDEKRMRRAEGKAERKRKRLQKKSPYCEKRSFDNKASSSSNYGQFFRGQSSGTKFRRFTSADLCFSCGKSGHWRRNCPNSRYERSI